MSTRRALDIQMPEGTSVLLGATFFFIVELIGDTVTIINQ